MSRSALTEESFVRNLPFNVRAKLAERLDRDKFWEQLASVIPPRPDDIFNVSSENFETRYSLAHIISLGSSGSGTCALIKDWGMQNCRIKHLVEALYKARLIGPAVYLQQDVLHIQPRRYSPNVQEGTVSDCRTHSPNVQEVTMSDCGTYSPNVLGGTVSDCGTYSPNIQEGTVSDCRTHSQNVQEGTVSDCRTHSQNVQEWVVSDCGEHSENSEKVNKVNPLPVPTHNEKVVVTSADTSSQACISDKQLLTSSTPTNGHIVENSVPIESEEQYKKSVQVAETPTPDDSQDTKDHYELERFPISLLRAITNNFDQRSFKDGGNLVGQGGFGTVFFGTLSIGNDVAVKCLKDSSADSRVQFQTEAKALAMFRHENLVQLFGYGISEDGVCSLVYEYLSNGSLEERLACRYDTEPLLNDIRLDIIRGTAAGLAFLHKGGLVHRDVKSANILLDDTFKPKVGDFATARVLPAGMSTQVIVSTVIGTKPYLAPEAYHFINHPSLDSYSFGVVILEVLTGLPVIDQDREEVDIKGHVLAHCCEGEDGEEAGSIYDLLDNKGGVWRMSIVESLYSISCRCLEFPRKKRPKMADILSELQRLN